MAPWTWRPFIANLQNVYPRLIRARYSERTNPLSIRMLVMINVEAAVSAKFPAFTATPALLRKAAIRFLRNLLHETEINAFLTANLDVSGFDWIERVFDYFDFSYTVSARDRANIPASGRVVIIANHPIGSLDGLALLRLVGEIRQDVKIVANDLLANFAALEPLLIPVDVMAGGSALRGYRQVVEQLEQEHAVIMFPSGEVSRASPLGVRDTLWRPGFLHFARKANAPVLPVHIAARNSLLFYSASMLFKPFGTVLLSDEMFKHQSSVIHFHVGEAIPCNKLRSEELHDRTLVARLCKHLYKLGRPHKTTFETERTVAHPENRQLLQQELKQAQLLGVTRDNNAIYLFTWSPDSAVIREIGRLRELAFRKVGEGTGKRRDLDAFDRHYRHLVLWDREAMEIAGAYRLGIGADILQEQGLNGFYTHSLYQYQPELVEYLRHGVELGRSFVNPAYWGKASLDYLWQGIGCYLAHHPDVRYLLGPVSVSASYPRALCEELVFYFTTYYGAERKLAAAHQPFTLSMDTTARFRARYANLDREQGFVLLQESFTTAGYRIPVLYRQYTALFEDGGFRVLAFGIDPDFSDCLDGFCMTDLSRLKASKRERYIAATPKSQA